MSGASFWRFGGGAQPRLATSQLGLSKAARGFTLLELLVVMVIGGILAAIALPSFLSQVNKAKQTEAKITLGSLNRAQQAFYLEKSQFADDIPSLGIGINPDGSNYTYPNPSNPSGTGTAVIQQAQSKSVSLKAYASMVGLVALGTEDPHLGSVICESKTPKLGNAANPQYAMATGPICNPNQTQPIGQ